ncbi:RNA polymerase sigma factor [candidate division KSB1 bacterium]|nr:RNA polymerase sigma factor [candidate division KSB1 bacterium]
MTDISLKDLKSGSEEAFKELVELHQDRVINICFRFLNNREDAEDTAQDVIVEVYQSINRFRGEAKLSIWIYRIAVSKSLDRIRKMKTKKRMVQLKSLFGLEAHEEPAAPTATKPDETLEQQERAAILHRCVRELAENQEIAITLNKYNEFSYKEIAEIMGTSLSAVESLIHRGMKNLKEKLYLYYGQNF